MLFPPTFSLHFVTNTVHMTRHEPVSPTNLYAVKRDESRKSRQKPPAPGTLNTHHGEHLPAPDTADIPVWVAYLGAIIAGLLMVFPALPDLASQYIGYAYTDMKITYRHWIGFGVRSVFRGELPLWNPFIYCGQPYMPSTHGTLLYPPNWPFLFTLPLPLSINLCIMAQIAILAAGTVFFVRTRGASNISALLAGSLASLGSLMTCRIFAGHFTMVCTSCWIPVMFALQQKLFCGDRRFMLPFAAAGAVMFMGGHLQYAYYYALFLALSVLLYAFCDVRSADRLAWMFKQLRWHLGASLIAFCLVAIEALPALDVASHSMRGAAKHLQFLREFSMPPENLVTLICPTFFGRGVAYWGRWEWWEATCYFGISGFVLCLVAIWHQLRTRTVSHLSILFFLCIFLAVAGFLPVIPKFLQYVPGWMMFRGHNRPMNFALVFGAVLAAHGFDGLRRESRVGSRAAVVLFASVAAVALALIGICGQEFWKNLLLSPEHRSELFNKNPAESLSALSHTVTKTRTALALTCGLSITGILLILLRKKLPLRIWQWCVVVFAVADMAWFAQSVPGFNPKLNNVPPETASFFASKKDEARSGVAGMMNEGTTHEIPSIEGDDIVVTRYYNAFLAAYLRVKEIMPTMTFTLQGESPLLDAANFVYVAMDKQSPAAISGGMVHEANLDYLAVFRRPGALPRAYVVGTAQWIEGGDSDHHRALMGKIDFRQEVLLTGKQDSATSESFDAVAAATVYHGLHKVQVTAPRSGWLVLTDGYYPHWKASIAGIDVPVLRANSAFRAVKVKQGDEVIFTYRNWVFNVGASITGITLLLVALWPGYRRIRSRNVRVASAPVTAGE